MRKLVIAAAGLLMVPGAYGCLGANITSHVRASDGASMQTRCELMGTGNLSDVEEYDGWKLIYVSEYTTANKTHSEAVMCFERPYPNEG